MACVPPPFVLTDHAAGGDGPLPGVAAGSVDGKSALRGVLAAPDCCETVVVVVVVELVPPDEEPPVDVVPAAFCVSWLPGVLEVPPVELSDVPEEVTEPLTPAFVSSVPLTVPVWPVVPVVCVVAEVASAPTVPVSLEPMVAVWVGGVSGGFSTERSWIPEE